MLPKRCSKSLYPWPYHVNMTIKLFLGNIDRQNHIAADYLCNRHCAKAVQIFANCLLNNLSKLLGEDDNISDGLVTLFNPCLWHMLLSFLAQFMKRNIGHSRAISKNSNQPKSGHWCVPTITSKHDTYKTMSTLHRWHVGLQFIN